MRRSRKSLLFHQFLVVLFIGYVNYRGTFQDRYEMYDRADGGKYLQLEPHKTIDDNILIWWRILVLFNYSCYFKGVVVETITSYF